MTSNEIREKYLKFFEDKGHARISPSALVLKDDPTTLFTSSGMQQLVPYLKGEKTHPDGKRLVDSQPSIRAHGKSDDILEVGDTRHLTIFEMLGNWSLGDYFKKEEIPWLWEFLTETLHLPKEKLWVSVFEGTKEVLKDTESIEIWESLGVPKERIREYGVKKNWWSRSGTPDEMPEGEIGGPTTEVFFDFDSKHNPKYGKECHPNCDCGRFSEIGNSVFMQYIKRKDGNLEELPQKNVDFGGGLERLSAAVSGQSDSFKTDLFLPLIQSIEEHSGVSYQNAKTQSAFRIISDHLKAAVFLIKNGIVPSNKEHGYVLRRLIRRAVAKLHTLNSNTAPAPLFNKLGSAVIKIYKGIYFQDTDQKLIEMVLEEEVKKFMATLEKGLRLVEKMEDIDAKVAFDLYQTYGFPFEITADIVKERGGSLDVARFKEEFERHRELSRASSLGMFKAK